MYKTAFPRLAELYAELERAQAALDVTCDGCGACCHFDVADHVLYASELERSYLLETARPPDSPDGGADLLARGLRCPYQRDERCQAREGRTLGCRLHFCCWSDAAAEAEFCERWHGRLKRMHDELGLEWGYGPLLPLERPKNIGEK